MNSTKLQIPVELLHKRIGSDDFLYAILGHPRDESINKQHTDNYKVSIYLHSCLIIGIQSTTNRTHSDE